MTSCILTLKKVLASSSSSKLKCGLSRGYSSQSSSSCALEQLDSHLQDLTKSLSPKVVALQSFFSSPDIHRNGTGVFVDPTLILTSAHTLGRIATFYESKPVEKADGFEHAYILHKSCIGRTVAVSGTSTELLKTTPLAVNFGNDLAVLKVVKTEEIVYPHCAVADSPPSKEDILMTIAQRRNSGELMYGNVRAVGERTVRAKAPWPLDDEVKWTEHDWSMFPGDPPPGSALFDCRGKITGVMSRVTGSPWFNLDGEVVGIASWEVTTDDPARFSVGFAVPSVCIKAVLDYAKMKRPEDPIVMDHWIDSRVIPGIAD